MAFTTAAAAVSALAYNVYSGERAASTQRDGRRKTQAAQNEATRIQMVERSRSVQKEMEANRPTPAQTVATDADNPLATDMTGGVSDRLKLARRSTLGGL
jgi:hypothetical protein